MPIIKFKPTTPSRRFIKIIDKSLLYKEKPLKKLLSKNNNKSGRNNTGRITVFHRGGGNTKMYRFIDFKRSLFDVPAEVIRIEYDPNRTGFIALLKYTNGIYSYILSPRFLKEGDVVYSSKNADISIGNTLLLKNIPVGTFIHNIEKTPGGGGKFARAAGAFGRIIKKLPGSGTVLVRLNNNSLDNLIELSANCLATIGIVSNSDFENVSLGKAGYSRWLGKRPVVRGVAMNPIDHPHGGGEGKTSGSKISKTPWGWPTKGYKTKKSFKKHK